MPTSTITTKAGNAIATGRGPTPEAAEEAAWDAALALYGAHPSKEGGRSSFARCVEDMERTGFRAVATVELHHA